MIRQLMLVGLASLCLTTVLVTPLLADPPAQAWPLEGPPFPARVTGVRGGTVQFESHVPVQLDDLAYWGQHRDRVTRSLVGLRSGGWLPLDLLHVSPDHVRGESPQFGPVEVPLSAVSTILLEPPANRLERDLTLARASGSAGDQDQLTLANGDVLTGQLMASSAAPENSPFVEFRVSGRTEPVRIELARIELMIPRRTEPAAARPAKAWIGWSDGTLLAVQDWSERQGALQLSTSEGVRLAVPADTWSEVDFLQPVSGRVTYLSDLEPLGFRHIPYLERTVLWGKDRNVRGGRLRHRGAVWPKGIGMPSTSRLAYELSEPYRRLQAELCIDDASGNEGSVVFRVFLQRTDGGEDWALAYASPIVRGGEPAIPVSLDLQGARRLALIVDFADRGDECDDANWLNARLVK